jgi:hypothetical protein
VGDQPCRCSQVVPAVTRPATRQVDAVNARLLTICDLQSEIKIPNPQSAIGTPNSALRIPHFFLPRVTETSIFADTVTEVKIELEPRGEEYAVFLKTLFAKKNIEPARRDVKQDDRKKIFLPGSGINLEVRIRIHPTTQFGYNYVAIISQLPSSEKTPRLSNYFEQIAAVIAEQYGITHHRVCWIEHYPADWFGSSLAGPTYHLVHWVPGRCLSFEDRSSANRQVVEFLIGEPLVEDIAEMAAHPQFQALVDLDTLATELSMIAQEDCHPEQLQEWSQTLRSAVDNLMSLI